MTDQYNGSSNCAGMADLCLEVDGAHRSFAGLGGGGAVRRLKRPCGVVPEGAGVNHLWAARPRDIRDGTLHHAANITGKFLARSRPKQVEELAQGSSLAAAGHRDSAE